MATKNQNQAPAIAAKLPQASRVSDFAEKWVGYAPEEIDPTIKNSDCEKVDLADLNGYEITVYGYIRKEGQTGDFVVMCATCEGHEKPFVVVTGASVVVKKMALVGEKRGFPTIGKVVERQGKRYRYFDME